MQGPGPVGAGPVPRRQPVSAVAPASGGVRGTRPRPRPVRPRPPPANQRRLPVALAAAEANASGTNQGSASQRRSRRRSRTAGHVGPEEIRSRSGPRRGVGVVQAVEVFPTGFPVSQRSRKRAARTGRGRFRRGPRAGPSVRGYRRDAGKEGRAASALAGIGVPGASRGPRRPRGGRGRCQRTGRASIGQDRAVRVEGDRGRRNRRRRRARRRTPRKGRPTPRGREDRQGGADGQTAVGQQPAAIHGADAGTPVNGSAAGK